MGQNLGPLNIKDTYQSLLQISGSDIVTDGTGSVVSSLDITATSATTAITANTASYVTGANVDGTVATATSASHALVADTALNVPSVNTGSLMETGSVAGNILTFTKADGSTFDLTVQATASSADSIITASVSDADITFTKGDASTFDITVDNVQNASFATNAGSATNATFAVTASYVAASNVDGTVASATSASHALVADTANTATTATTASYVLGSNVDGDVATATSASHALVADSVLGTVTNATSASYVPGAGVDGAVALATEVDVTTQTSGQYRVAFTDQTGTTSGISNSTSLTWDETTDTLAGAAEILATTFTGDLTGDVTGNADTATTATSASYALTASFAENVTTPTLDEVTTQGATTTNSVTTGDLTVESATATGSLDVKPAGGTPLEIRSKVNDFSIGIPDGGSSGDFTLRGATTGPYVMKMYTTSEIHLSGSVTKVDSDISVSGAVSASTYYGDGSNLENLPSSPAFPYTGSVDIASGQPNYSGGSNTQTAIVNIDATSGTVSANGNENVFAGGLYSRYSGSSAEDIEIDNNQNTFVWGGERSQFSSITVNNVTGSVGLAIGGNNQSAYFGTDGSYPNPPRQVAMIAASGQFRGGMIHSAAIATSQVNMNGAGNYGYGMVVLGGQNARLNRNYRSVIIAGNNNQMPNSFQDGLGIFNGNSNTVYGNNNTVVGGQSGQMSGGSNNYVGGARGYNINADTCAIFGGWGSTISSGHTDVIVGGRNNVIQNRNTNEAAGNGILFGKNNILESNNMDQTFIVGGAHNNVSGSFQGGGIIGGSGSLAYHDRSVIIGGRDMTTQETDTVYVPNFVVSGSVKGEVGALTITSNTASMDCSSGNFFTLAMPAGGDVHLVPTNIQTGQTINVKTTQNATAATISFPASVEFEGGTAFTVSTGAAEVDVMTFVSFDGTSLQATGLKNFS